MYDVLKKEHQDLQLFGDPFEDFDCRVADGKWTAELIRGGVNYRVIWHDNERISVYEREHRDNEWISVNKRGYKDFRALLVSSRFADLKRLANAQRHVTRFLVDEKTGDLKEFLPNRGEIQNAATPDDLSYEKVSEILKEKVDHLRIFVINGVAGVGKTRLIERIVRDRASPTSYNAGNPLLLHVQSLGKVLTALDDRIEGSLSSLRASFVLEELKPLIRRGVIQLAIDGFDELSDNRGYARAWGALNDFIRELEGKGTCLLAGRDTMLDKEAVRKGLSSDIREDHVTILNLQRPSPREIRTWLSRQDGWQERNDKQAREALNQMERQAGAVEYLGRPFFIQKIANLRPSQFKELGGEPIVALMESMIARESEKILPKTRRPVSPQRVSALYSDVLSEAARMMMDDETDGIDIDLLGLLIEESFTGEVDKETVDALVQRAGTLALFETDSRNDRVRIFPHDNIKSYFFSKSIVDYIPKHGITTGIYRVPMGLEDFRMFNCVARSSENVGAIRSSLQKSIRGVSDHGYLMSNLGGLLLSILPIEEDNYAEDDLAVANMDLKDVWMAEQVAIQRANISNCRINRLDVRGTDLSGVSFSNVIAHEMLANDYVVFGNKYPQVNALVLRDDKGYNERIFDPKQISEWMNSRIRQRSRRREIDPRWKILEKFARISMRRYWVRGGDQDTKRITGSPHWDSLVELLKNYERIDFSNNVPSAGPRSAWFHLILGEEFLRTDSDEIGDNAKGIMKELGVIK